jgi:hypothetical protein
MSRLTGQRCSLLPWRRQAGLRLLAAGYRLLADSETTELLSPPGEKACCKGFIFEKESAND